MCVVWLLTSLFVIICYYDLPSDNIQETNTAAINDAYTSSVENTDSVPRLRKHQRQPSFVDKMVLWKGSYCSSILLRQ